MKTITNANITGSGTSFYGQTVKASVNELTDILGPAKYQYTDIDGKTQNEWLLESRGRVVTLYDYKEYRKYSHDEPLDFHIGGHSQQDTEQAKLDIEEELIMLRLLSSLNLN